MRLLKEKIICENWVWVWVWGLDYLLEKYGDKP